jgi:hypothetical protein
MSTDMKNRPMDVIEDALQSYPLAAVPGGLKSRVMRSVRAKPRMPAFAFPWLEASLSLLATVMLMVVSFLMLGISPVSLRLLAEQVHRFLFASAYGPVTTAALAGLGLIILCVFAAAAIFALPHPRRRLIRSGTR